jgi:hypothetical protein
LLKLGGNNDDWDRNVEDMGRLLTLDFMDSSLLGIHSFLLNGIHILSTVSFSLYSIFKPL